MRTEDIVSAFEDVNASVISPDVYLYKRAMSVFEANVERAQKEAEESVQ